MQVNDAYTALNDHYKSITALSQISGLLGWDQETTMPEGSAAQRGEWMGALSTALHERRTDARIGGWIDALDDADLEPVQAATVRQARRSFERHSRVPASLASKLAKETSTAQMLWAKAREADDFAMFRDTLALVLDLRREEAAALAQGGTPYEALLQDYEPGMAEAELATLLGGLRDGLVELRRAIMDSDVAVPDLSQTFATDSQTAIARDLATAFGYDWTRGRLDFAVHPFSSGSGNDVRITTRVSERDPFNCFYSTIHEVGHATYEQGVDPAYMLTPLGRGASMGVHESQSRILENQLGRSREFCGFLYGRMRDAFGDFGVADEDSFYAVVNKVRRGFIRTEADEVQYNLHVLLRFDLERDLISGTMEVDDLEEAWNARFEADFGYPVDKPSNGVLQDVHWSCGLFGYFPTYSLGNIYAGELYARLREDVPTLDRDLEGGDTTAAIAWLRENIHRHGSFYEPTEVMERAVGHTPTAAPLLRYLQAKFGAIYNL
ncbi:MAG: carboxypeptidase M32 [Pseudomonadota bacterium]